MVPILMMLMVLILIDDRRHIYTSTRRRTLCEFANNFDVIRFDGMAGVPRFLFYN